MIRILTSSINRFCGNVGNVGNVVAPQWLPYIRVDGDGVMVGSARLPGNRVHDQYEAYFNEIVLW